MKGRSKTPHAFNTAQAKRNEQIRKKLKRCHLPEKGTAKGKIQGVGRESALERDQIGERREGRATGNIGKSVANSHFSKKRRRRIEKQIWGAKAVKKERV